MQLSRAHRLYNRHVSSDNDVMHNGHKKTMEEMYMQPYNTKRKKNDLFDYQTVQHSLTKTVGLLSVMNLQTAEK